MTADPFARIRAETDRHRAAHGCGAYPFENGLLLSIIAAAAGPARLLELGTALGYTALSLLRHLPAAKLDTVERDREHVRLARETIAAEGFAGRIAVHEGAFGEVLPGLDPGYGLAFFDGYAPSLADMDAFERLVAPGGVLLSANVNLAGAETGAYAARLADPGRWASLELPGVAGTWLSVRQPG
jgi:predicted O-methyltransferase YrrM